MAEVKWIKIVTDIFDDEKMLLIESMPEADSVIVIWFKLLCMAGKQNNSGVFMLNDRIAYTDEMLATIFRRPLNTVRLAIKTFENFGMIKIIDNVLTIPNWEKHQSLDELEKVREKNRNRVAAYREKQKLLADRGCNVTGHYIVTPCNAIDKNREEENRIEEDKNRDIQRACAREESDEEETLPEFENPLYKQIAKLYNGTCTSLPKVTTISSARERVIKTRLKEFTVKQFQTLFRKAQASKFLTGKNKNNWRANFDWLMNATNFAKVLDGNYDDYVAPHDGMSGKPEDDLPF